MTRRGIVLCFALVIMLLAGSSLLAEESRTLLIHDEHGAFLQTDTRPSEMDTPAAEDPPERDEVIWHRNIAAIYYTTSISREERIFTGAWNVAEMHAVSGDGTPLWEHSDAETYTAAARDADRFVSVTIYDPIAGAMIRGWQEGSSTPLWSKGIFDCTVSGYCLQVSHDGTLVSVGLRMAEGGGTPRIYNLDGDTGATISTFDGVAGTPRALVLSDDGSLVAARLSATVYVIETATGTERWSIGVGASADPLAFSGDGNLLASGWTTMLVYQWNGDTYQSLWSNNGGGGSWYLRQCAFSADGSALVAAWYTTNYNQNKVQWFDPTSSTPLWTHTPLPSGGSYQDLPATLAVDEEGLLCAVGSWGDQLNQNPELHIYHRDIPTPIFTVDCPGSVFDVAICSRTEGGGAYVSACGKNVHANQMGSGGDLYSVEVDLPHSTSLPDGPATGNPFLTAFPNPFNPQVTLRFVLPEAGFATLEVFALDGRKVRQIARGDFPAGSQDFLWDGRDNAGQTTASGVYLARLKTQAGSSLQRLVMLK